MSYGAHLLESHCLVERKAGDLLRRIAPRHLVGDDVPVPDAEVCSFDREAQTGLAVGERLLDRLPLGDVDVGPAVAERVAVGFADHPAAAEDPADLSIRPANAIFAFIDVCAAGDGVGVTLIDPLAIFEEAEAAEHPH